jgi:hypothetical protein
MPGCTPGETGSWFVGSDPATFHWLPVSFRAFDVGRDAPSACTGPKRLSNTSIPTKAPDTNPVLDTMAHTSFYGTFYAGTLINTAEKYCSATVLLMVLNTWNPKRKAVVPWSPNGMYCVF